MREAKFYQASSPYSGNSSFGEGYVLYILTSIWVLRTPNAGLIVIFSICCAKKLKKCKESSKFGVKFSKKKFFWVSTQTLVYCFILKNCQNIQQLWYLKNLFLEKRLEYAAPKRWLKYTAQLVDIWTYRTITFLCLTSSFAIFIRYCHFSALSFLTFRRSRFDAMDQLDLKMKPILGSDVVSQFSLLTPSAWRKNKQLSSLHEMQQKILEICCYGSNKKEIVK